MDGVLIDSIPLWFEAKIKSFKKVGIDLTYEMCFQSTGLKVNEMVDYWYDKFPWDNIPKKEIEEDIMDNVVGLVKEKGVAISGTEYILDFFREKKVKIGLASSSQMRLIDVAIEKMGIKKYFDDIYSAEFEKKGKPDPAIYLSSARSLGIAPKECIAFEDSLNGLLSAKSAGMKCICIPDEALIKDEKLKMADLVLKSLNDFNEESWNEFNRE